MTESTTADIHAQIREPWLQFVRITAEHRPALFAFGLKLTGSPFDGEDLDRIPRTTRLAWPAHLEVWMDRSRHLVTVGSDQHRVIER